MPDLRGSRYSLSWLLSVAGIVAITLASLWSLQAQADTAAPTEEEEAAAVPEPTELVLDAQEAIDNVVATPGWEGALEALRQLQEPAVDPELALPVEDADEEAVEESEEE